MNVPARGGVNRTVIESPGGTEGNMCPVVPDQSGTPSG